MASQPKWVRFARRSPPRFFLACRTFDVIVLQKLAMRLDLSLLRRPKRPLRLRERDFIS